MPAQGGTLLYKCRSCGKIVKGCHVPEVDMVLISLMLRLKPPVKWSGTIGESIIHDCGNSKVGICDIVGAEYDA